MSMGQNESTMPASDPSAWQPLINMGKPLWWKNIFKTSFCFAPQCILPAIVWSLAFAVVFGSFALVQQIMNAQTNPGLAQILQCFFLLLGTLVVALGLVIWGLSAWLTRLTSFCRILLLLPADAMLDQNLSKTTIKECAEKAIKEVAQHKAHIAKLWFFVTLYMIVPVTAFFGISLALCLTTPELIGVQLLTLPKWLTIAFVFVACAIALFLTSLSLIALAASAHFHVDAKRAASRAFSLSLSMMLPACTMTLLLLLINVFVSSPEIVFQLQHPQSFLATKFELGPMLAEHLWQTLTSVVMWSFTTAPLCDMVRAKMDGLDGLSDR